MGQKTNPLALRIRYNNLDFDNTWFSEKEYANCLAQNLQLNEYTKNFSKHLNLPENKIAVNLNFKQNNIYSFFCIPVQSRFLRSRQFKLNTRFPRFWNQIRNQQRRNSSKFKYFQKNRFNRLKTFQISTSKLEKLTQLTTHKYFYKPKSTKLINSNHLSTLPITTKSIKNNNNLNYLFKDLQTLEYTNKASKKTLKSKNDINLYHQAKFKLRYFLLNYFFALKTGSIFNYSKETSNSSQLSIQQFYNSSLTAFPTLTSKANLKKNKIDSKTTIPFYFFSESPTNRNYQNYLTNYISTQYNLPFHSYNFWLQQDFQNAGFLADEIVYFLEKRVPFKRIKHRIAKEMNNCSWINGIRLEFSGRVSARSKKAQRAKHEVIKLGQTSLHVFNYKIDYAARTAYTSYGSVGIKVWICYK
uniref:Ribosomal protein S3 n=1 Tax=Prototheca zopfii TaxID=3112 RepID=A0A2P1G7V3_9CHLO|nr:ribosomal protein S3 [Prototheca ciferrii]AVM80926.1 ribosomal protein S3 [Prototheca ciferrii]